MKPTAGPAHRRQWRAALALAGLVLGPGCAGDQSALDPAGPQAGRIGGLWWLYFGVCTAVYAVVVGLVIGALWSKARARRLPPIKSPPPPQERRLRRAVVGGVSVTSLTLMVLMVAEFATARSLHSPSRSEDLTIRVTGHQWWWEVQYQDPTPSQIVTTANEIHIPVGKVVRFELRSSDVIHSFWVPNLQGKRDMIPGQTSRIVLKADRPGTFHGQCAEFCGLEHAFMRLVVVAEPEERFRAWLDAQRQSATEPTAESQGRGMQVFLKTTCIMCHTIQGTPAQGRVGPDLTHVGSRSMIAGILPNARGHLAGWVVDPQRIKPGVRMPMNLVRPDEIEPLLDYLESLK
jgi:cytochrome c oxidase subunit 2